MSLTRRALLGGAVALAATACRSRGHEPLARDPDAEALVAARDSERALLAAYDTAIATGGADAPTLARVRADHAAHLAALHVRSSAATPAPAGADLRAAERASAATLRAAAVAAVQGQTAAVLASIAASHASHEVVLAPLKGTGRR